MSSEQDFWKFEMDFASTTRKKRRMQNQNLDEYIGGTGDGDILIVGDLFRLAHDMVNGWSWQQEYNVSWLREIIAGAFATCPLVRVIAMNHAMLGITSETFGPKAGQSTETWWVEQIGKPVDPALAITLRTAVAGRIVIAFEVSDNILDVLAETALAVLHIQISPVHFSDDSLLSASTTNSILTESIERAQVSDRELYWQLGITRARMGLLSQEKAFGSQRMALIVAQTPFDRSLIRDGRVHTLADHHEEIHTIANDHNITLISPHPYSDRGITGIGDLASIPGLRITAANCYRMMAAGVIDEVVSVSSSILSEAPYFGIPARGLGGYIPSVSPMIRIQALGEAIADGIANLLAIDLPLSGDCRLPSGPIINHILGYGWGRDRIEQAQFLLPALVPNELPRTLLPSEPDFSRALGYGWYGVEEWGVWCGSLGVLNIEWPEHGSEPILCVLHLRTVDFGSAAQAYEIWSDGENLARGILLGDTPARVAFHLSPPTREGPVQIWIIPHDPFRPSEVQFGNPDSRLLGVAMSSYELVPGSDRS